MYLLDLQQAVHRLLTCWKLSILRLIMVHRQEPLSGWGCQISHFLQDQLKYMSLTVCMLSGQWVLQVVKTISSGRAKGGDFVASCSSPKGKWLHCLGEDGFM